MGLVFEDLRLATPDGLSLHAWYLPGPDTRRGAVLFCHGNGGNISHRLETLRILHDLGFSVLIFDYRGYGQSDGKPSEEGFYQDAQAAYEFLTQDKGFDPAEIVLWGRSLGAAVACRLAAGTQAGALVLESGFTSIPDMAAKRYPFLPSRLLSRFGFHSLNTLPAVRCPTLVIHSPEDQTVPYEFGCKLYEAAPEPKAFLEIQGGHNDGFLHSRDTYTSGIKDFFNKNGFGPGAA